MEKETKKKVIGTAGAAAAVAGAAGIAAAVYKDHLSEELADAVTPADDDDIAVPILEGEDLPEVEITGRMPDVDGDVLPELQVVGHATAHTSIASDTENIDMTEQEVEGFHTPHMDMADHADVLGHGVSGHIDHVDGVGHIDGIDNIGHHETLGTENSEQDDFEEDIDNDGPLLADNVTKDGDSSILEDLIQKTRDALGSGSGHDNEMNDFVNDADVTSF